MGFKIQISKNDFMTVLKTTKVLKKLGKVNIKRERVEFTFKDTSLHVFVIGSERVINGVGTGKGTAFIGLPHYQVLQKVPPHQDLITIEYNSDKKKLIVGTTSFPTLTG